jgi:hypothetical protein
MKYALTLFAAMTGGIVGLTATTSAPAQAQTYCQYINYPANCIVRPGARLVARPVARGAAAARADGAINRRGAVNRGGPVNRAGRR